ncbi:hypothetical protein BDP27DRAFT_1329966, partial [Rhodocollybia butyracea]
MSRSRLKKQGQTKNMKDTHPRGAKPQPNPSPVLLDIRYFILSTRTTLSSRSGEGYHDGVRVLDAYGDWVRGSVLWSFVTDRYFGIDNSIIRKTRCITLKTPFSDTINFV